MFFLVTGASGAGKSTVRRLVEKTFDDRLVITEFATLGVRPEWNLSWRHQMVERIVLRAIQAQREGRPFMLCGDPVPLGELLAAPSADQLESIAVCLLDVSEAAQRDRLTARGDDPNLLAQHVAFADWMRGHAADPGHRPEVIMQSGWEAMRWDRWVGRADVQASWNVHVIDTTAREPEEIAVQVVAWIRSWLGENATESR
jgi:hypothetical protein